MDIIARANRIASDLLMDERRAKYPDRMFVRTYPESGVEQVIEIDRIEIVFEGFPFRHLNSKRISSKGWKSKIKKDEAT